jgi:hypothetical protein
MPTINNLNNYGGQVNVADHIGQINFTPDYSKTQFNEFVKELKLSKEDTDDLEKVYKQIDKDGLKEDKATETLIEINQKIEEVKSELPVQVQKKIEELPKLDTSTKMDGLFKFTIPILPGIISYEFQAKNNIKEYFKQIWQDLKEGKVFFEKEEK